MSIKIHFFHQKSGREGIPQMQKHPNPFKSYSKKFVVAKGEPASKSPPLEVTTGSGKTPNSFSVISWNVNGIRNAINKYLIRDLIIKCSPDIICINETKINQAKYQKERIQVDGYHGYWNFCKTSAGYSGVAVFTKFIPSKVEEDVLEPEHSQEGRVLTLQFELFFLVIGYIPFAGLQLERLHYKTQQFEPAFFRHCERIRAKGKGVIVCGDLNTAVDYLDTYFTAFTIKNPGFTKLQRKNLKLFLDLGWVDTFRKLNPESKKFTWWNLKHNGRELRIGKRFDYFLVNEQFKDVVVASDVLEDLLATDHSPIELRVDLSLRQISQKIENYANLFWLKSSESEVKKESLSQEKDQKEKESECLKQQKKAPLCLSDEK